MTKKLNQIQDRVEIVLRNNELARNDDKFLIGKYLNQFHSITNFISYYNSKDVPSFETITRCRRKCQAEGRCLSDKQILEGRKQAEINFQKWSRK